MTRTTDPTTIRLARLKWLSVGEKWLPSVEPLRIMILIGFLRTIGNPCSHVLAAQDRLTEQMIAQTAALVTTVVACLIGLNWGLAGVAWASVATAVIFTAYAYMLVCRTIPTGPADLFKAATPALMLNGLLFAILALTHLLLREAGMTMPWVYLSTMVLVGGVGYGCAFLFLPIPALRAEALRWRQTIAGALRFARKPPA